MASKNRNAVVLTSCSILFYCRLAELLGEQRAATKENVTRKQARTAGEKEESDEEEQASESDDDDDDEVPYNPKILPLGWDGKVI